MQYDETKEHRSLSLSYDLSMKSYDWMLKRADDWDGNLDKILTWGTSINAGIVAIILNLHKDSTTSPIANAFGCSFWIALIVFIFAIIVGFVGKSKGKITLASPNVICDDDWTTLSEDEFKRYAIRYSGSHFKKNNAYVDMKANFANWTTILFIIVAVLNVVWAASI